MKISQDIYYRTLIAEQKRLTSSSIIFHWKSVKTYLRNGKLIELNLGEKYRSFAGINYRILLCIFVLERLAWSVFCLILISSVCVLTFSWRRIPFSDADRQLVQIATWGLVICLSILPLVWFYMTLFRPKARYLIMLKEIEADVNGTNL